MFSTAFSTLLGIADGKIQFLYISLLLLPFVVRYLVCLNSKCIICHFCLVCLPVLPTKRSIRTYMFNVIY